MKGSTNYATTQTAVELLGIANNGIAVAEDLNRQLQFFVVLAKNYLGGQDACLVFDRDGKLMKGTEKINSVDVNCKPIIVSLPNSNTYVVAMLNNNQQPVYHVVNMGLPGYGPVGNMGEVLSANNPLDGNSSITSKHGLHFTGSEDHINGHTMVFDTRYTADPAAAGQGTTDIMAYDFGSSTLTPVANKLYSSYGCGDTKQGQLQISPDGSQLAWWRYTNNLGGFDHRNAEIHTLPLNASKTALSGPVVTRSISAAGSYGNGALEFIKNSSDLLYSQRGLYKENNNGTGPAYDRNVWKYSPVNLSSVRINPNTSSPMISYLFGEIKRGSDGNYYIPQMGKANDQIHAYNNANFNSDISLGDTMYKLSSSLPTQVYKIFEDPTASVKEFVRSVGNKAYELKDHLGNVRVVISDVKQFSMTGSTGNYYLDLQFFPEVKNYTDYYAFGMPMPARQFNNGSYRYSFQGKEQDNEVKGTGNSLDFGARINDPRLGRWLSIDPLASKYPWQSPYSSMDNKPIWLIDPTGMGTEDWVKGKDGKIKWDANATSQETTQEGEIYLGKNVVEFKGSRNEKLGTKDGKNGYINGDGAVTADVTFYGPNGPDDIHNFKGYTMSSNASQFGAIDEGLYNGNYDVVGKKGKLKSNWTINRRGHVRMMDGKVNPNAPSQLEPNGEGYKDGIFIHTSNNDGFAGTIPGGSAISVGCLLIVPTDWQLFNSAMSGVKNFKVQVTREAPTLVPLEGINGEVEGRQIIRNTLKTD